MSGMKQTDKAKLRVTGGRKATGLMQTAGLPEQGDPAFLLGST